MRRYPLSARGWRRHGASLEGLGMASAASAVLGRGVESGSVCEKTEIDKATGARSGRRRGVSCCWRANDSVKASTEERRAARQQSPPTRG